MSVDQHRGKTNDELLSEIDAAWQRLMNTMTSRPKEEYTTRRDDVGWTPLDHLAHVTAWERTVLFPLQGRTRHEALGVTDEQFTQGEDPLDDFFDGINQLVRDQTIGDSYEKVMADAREVHDQTVAALRQTTVNDLWKPSREMSSDTHEAARDVPFIEIVMSDACTHFDDHRGYIEKILAG
jgi:hypothetical protein